MTYAEPPGSWEVRKSAVARAEVKIASSGTSSPPRASRAARSRGVKIELLVSTRNRRRRSTRRSRNSLAPGRALPSCTRTPSMSVSQHSIGPRSVVTGPTLVRSVRSDAVAGYPPEGVRSIQVEGPRGQVLVCRPHVMRGRVPMGLRGTGTPLDDVTRRRTHHLHVRLTVLISEALDDEVVAVVGQVLQEHE